MKGVAILGATGSIGTATLSVLRRHSERFHVTALSANRNWQDLDKLAVEFEPNFVALSSVPPAEFEPQWDGEWRYGSEAVEAAARGAETDIVLNAIMGVVGLGPSLAALESGKRLALANKESLVVGGTLLLNALDHGSGELLPVDSEHSAIHQCLNGRPFNEIRRITLTASGGPFRTWSQEALVDIRPSDALRHPTWDMGAKITIDSATLANKAIEVIEAHALFGVDFDQIGVVVHPTSIAHSFVEFHDGSCLGQLGRPTMETPILWALGCPERIEDSGDNHSFNPLRDGPLEFEAVRNEDFPLFDAGVAAGRVGGELPIAFNAANEVAVSAFLEERVSFTELVDVVLCTLERFSGRAVLSVEDIWKVDARARRFSKETVHALRAGATIEARAK